MTKIADDSAAIKRRLDEIEAERNAVQTEKPIAWGYAHLCPASEEDHDGAKVS